MKTETATPNALLSLFRPSNGASDDNVDFGARFLRPPPVSMQNHVVDTAPGAGKAQLKIDASTMANMADLLKTLNLTTMVRLGSDLGKTNISNLICATPSSSESSPREKRIPQFAFDSNESSPRMNPQPFAFQYPPLSPPISPLETPPTSPPARFAPATLNLNLKKNSFSSDAPSDDDVFPANGKNGSMANQPPLCSAYNGVYMDQILRQAKVHRTAAAFSNATCTWRGQLSTRNHRNAQLSPKVFLGGVPWDVSEASLIAIFSKFGTIQVQWPGREVKCSSRNTPAKCGYVYIVFENQDCVQALLNECIYDNRNGGKWFYNIPTKRMPLKEVQVIPWVLADSNWVKNPSQRLDPNRTVFVGALHGMITAESLARIMNDLFDDVVYVGIDTDKKKYPVGSARVSFSSNESYLEAIKAGFVEIKCNKFTKKVRFPASLLFLFLHRFLPALNLHFSS